MVGSQWSWRCQCWCGPTLDSDWVRRWCFLFWPRRRVRCGPQSLWDFPIALSFSNWFGRRPLLDIRLYAPGILVYGGFFFNK
ncbi:unnamed protein product [Prunus armeniaca]|uniref:Uncharacterized protein n=1 Tax=Prunus armeniaca TaxID=36596 RepID=A0A6J5XPG6_PRUAR|nr:unnamed protein product [Prunus armeniaca]